MPKYALITGGTKGIGKSVAFSLAHAGYDLLLTYGSDTDTAKATAASIKKDCNVTVEVLQADISNSQSIEDIECFLTAHSLKLDAIVFNAGLTYRASFEQMELAEWERMFFANVHFPVFLLQKLIAYINPGGSVVFTGSLMGIEPHATSLSYGVTKSAVHALTKNLVKFLSPYQIRVNAVAPGFIDTEWQKDKPKEIRMNIERKLALGRFCDPDELADVYKMLIENSYFDGEVIVVSGGYSYK
ncbi:MAG: SDR family oxidoreductase [Tannerella sp.]|jgi:3-oxoacyl-[acyl-carrier protein] reductase|nr:SDR family oxidoreductase [Tannerella sp.]